MFERLVVKPTSWRVGELASWCVSFCENLPAGRQVCEKPLSEYFFNRKGRKVLCKAREGKILNSIVNYVPIVVKKINRKRQRKVNLFPCRDNIIRRKFSFIQPADSIIVCNIFPQDIYSEPGFLQ